MGINSSAKDRDRAEARRASAEARENLQAMLAFCRERSLGETDLDPLVDDAVQDLNSTELNRCLSEADQEVAILSGEVSASAINNSGSEGQLRFLLGAYTPAEIQARLVSS